MTMSHTKLLWIMICSLALLARCATTSAVAQGSTVVFVVRHAEKLDPADGNSPISPAGEERAQELANTLGKSHVQRIYATSKLRTQQTVAPLAKKLGIEPVILEPGATGELVGRIKADAEAKVVLVCGHSNTVPDIVKALSGIAVDGIPEERFDRLFKLTIPADGKATVEEMRYGAPTP